ncbi:putative dihydrofolate reductase, partial [Paramicrosporidium saccamoebae]
MTSVWILRPGDDIFSAGRLHNYAQPRQITRATDQLEDVGMPLLSNQKVDGRFAVVAAVTKEWGIGNEEKLPWHPKRLQLDMAFLKFVTTHHYECCGDSIRFTDLDTGVRNAVIMGRKTWDSIPTRFKPMEDRINIIVTRDVHAKDGNRHPDVVAVTSFESAVEEASRLAGGSGIYEAALNRDYDGGCDCVFLTRLTDHPSMPCDTHFPGTLLDKYPRVINITRQCQELLTPTVKLTDDGEHVVEGAITYRIDAF